MTQPGEPKNPDRTASVLAERARALARPAAAPAATDVIDVVTFRLAGETYGIEASHVREVCRLTELSPLPGAEPPAMAVTVWRGDLLMLLDLRRGLGLAPNALNDLRQVVVVDTPAGPAGVLADEVLGMASIRASELETSAGGRSSGQYVRGVTQGAIIVLDPGSFAAGESREVG